MDTCPNMSHLPPKGIIPTETATETAIELWKGAYDRERLSYALRLQADTAVLKKDYDHELSAFKNDYLVEQKKRLALQAELVALKAELSILKGAK